MSALAFSLPVGLPAVGVAAGGVTNLQGVTQGDVTLGAWRMTAVDTLTNNVQQDAQLTDFRIANMSTFCSNGASFPAAALAFQSQSKDEIIDVTLAAGTSVQMSVTGGAAAGGYDVGASIQTDPIKYNGPDADLQPGQAPGDVALDDLALLFPLGVQAIGGVVGVTVQLAALCNRTCRLGKLFLTTDAANYVSCTSILVGGVEQLAQSTVVGIPLQHFAPTSTMQSEYMDLDVVITPGEQVQISLLQQSVVPGNVFGGIYCLPL